MSQLQVMEGLAKADWAEAGQANAGSGGLSDDTGDFFIIFLGFSAASLGSVFCFFASEQEH